MRILIDLDDTMEDLCGAWVNYLNKKHSLSVRRDDIDVWDIASRFPTLTEEEVFAPLYREDFWETVKPVDGAVKYIRRIIEDGHDVYIVTASHPETFGIKYRYIIKRYFPFINSKMVVSAYDKSIIRGDILIDDGPHNFENWRHVGILFDAPFNKSFDEKTAGIVRAKSWEEIYSYIRIFTDIINES